MMETKRMMETIDEDSVMAEIECRWSEEIQLINMQEACASLIAALCRFRRLKIDFEPVMYELVDVLIVGAQLRRKDEKLYKIIHAEKLQRLKEHLEES
jgi:hypothetical protein